MKKNNKSKNTFVASLLIISMILTGTACGKNNKKGTIVDSTTNQNLMSSDNNESNDYVIYFTTNAPDYFYEESYISNIDVELILEELQNDKKCKNENNSDINIEEVIDKIYNNSLIYIQSYGEYNMMLRSKDSNSKITCYNNALNQALSNIFNYATNDISEDLCMFETVKIVDKSFEGGDLDDVVGAYYYKKNLIVVDSDKINDIANKKGVELETYLAQVLQHELNHVRQYICSCQKKQGELSTTIDYYDYVCILREASAESAIYNLSGYYEKDTKDYTYPSARQKEALLFCLALFRDNIELSDYYNAIFDNDVKSLYEFFGATTTDEIYNLYKLIYTIDALEGRTGLDSTKDSYELSLLEINLKTDIFRLVLKNMVNYTINNDNFTLEDNLFMFKLMQVLLEIEETSKDYFGYYKLEYEKFLSEHYKVSLADTIEKELDTDLYGIVWEMEQILKTPDIVIDNDDEYAACHLLEKFPMLKAILFANNYLKDINVLTKKR